MNAVTLPWKEFTVDLEKAKAPFAAILGVDYDGMVGSADTLLVLSKNPISEEHATAIETWWTNSTPADFQPTMTQIITGKIMTAADFGTGIILAAKVGNVAQGITQAGKTKEVSDYLHAVARYLNEGSLYAAVAALDEMIAAEIPADLTPWITVERLTATKNQIQDFLGIPLT